MPRRSPRTETGARRNGERLTPAKLQARQQSRATGRLSQTSLAYPPGPLVRPDDLRRGPKPGQRCAYVDVRTHSGTARLHDVLRHGRHVLLIATSDARAGLAANGVERFPGLVEVVEADLGPAFTLVRPDGVVAVRGSRYETGRIVDYLRQLLGAGDSAPEPSLALAGGGPR